jgi:energy-coupling factor transporter ATP-binding protein EcfA2
VFLKTLVLVNWGNIPNGEFAMGPINLFSGANGSGKTTAADAIQTLMTAAHESLFQYNPGQEETTQRGRGGKRVRTLASYILGCDDGSYARLEPTDGYIAAVFHPTQGETAEPFTAIVAVRAWLDRSGKVPLAREDQIAFFVLPGVEAGIDAFIVKKQVVLLDDIERTLITRFGKKSVERYDQKRAYLRRLYAALRGKRDSVSEREAMHAARAFSRFMAYKPVSSISQFVADEVLERKDLGDAVRSVSSQLKTIHDMEREAQAYKDSAAMLEQAGHHAQAYIEGWIERVTLDYSLSQADYRQRQEQYLKARNERDAVARQIKENIEELAATEQQREQVHGAVVRLEAQRENVEPLRRKDQLERDLKTLTDKLGQAARELLSQDQQLQRNLQAARNLAQWLAAPSLMAELPQFADMDARRLVEQARSFERLGDIDLSRFLQKDLTGDLSQLEQHLQLARGAQRAHNELADFWRAAPADQPTRRDQFADAHGARRRRYEALSAQCQQKQQEIERLEAKQTVYPPYVERALAAIRLQCPKADARVLCDHIEVADARWQSAIEGYLGGNRFGIIVDADYEADAIRIVRSMAGRDNRARVIQGSKALRDASRVNLPSASIVHVLKFTHGVAQAYMVANYGSVVRVDSAEELRQTARGVTADGMGSGGYSMFRCDIADADLVFGAAARERALVARRQELEQLLRSRQEANDKMQETARVLEAVDRLQPVTYADGLAAVLATHREIRGIEMLLTQLDVTAWQSLDEQLQRLQNEERDLWARISALNKRRGELDHELASLGRRIEALGEQKDEAHDRMAQAEEQLRALHAGWPEFDLEARLRFAEEEATSIDLERADVLRDEVMGRLMKSERAMNEILQEHNRRTTRPSDAIVYTAFSGTYDSELFKGICGLRRDIDRVFNILKNNVLVEKHTQLQQLKQSFNNAFVSHLCQAIHQAITEGKRRLESLNKELENHRFGSDRERFRFDAEWVPEYRDYARFFEDVVRNPAVEGDSLFESKLSAKSAAVRDSLMALLLGADEQQSQRELERIADYRNYYRYEIYKEVEGKPPIALSEYGTGSGGQLETPAYIIRAASITSALHYNEGVNHLRMVLVDEAFSKMDETRSREVIDYLTRTLGLQLVFIMPTSKCGPFMDLISNEFVFAKVPSAPRGELHTRVIVDRKQCNQDRIKALWAQHRRTVHQQAELDFMQDVLVEERT